MVLEQLLDVLPDYQDVFVWDKDGDILLGRYDGRNSIGLQYMDVEIFEVFADSSVITVRLNMKI